MQLHCPYCAHDIPAADINLDRMVAKCASCSAVFSFDDQIDAAPQRPLRLEVPLPKGITVEREGYELAITRRWMSPKYFLLIFFCLIWDGFLCFWYSIALAGGAWIMAVFALGHTAIGALITYSTIAGFVNSTLIRVGSGALAVRHGPLPWSGNKQLDSSGITQIYCKERIQRGRNSTTTTYEVHAATNGGVQAKLVDGLDSDDQALYLEQEIERFLSIKDVPVAGELRK